MAAATQFCGIAELLEMVLLDIDLSPLEVLLSQRVSQAFRSAVTASPALQRKLSKLPDNTLLEERQYGNLLGQFEPGTNFRHDPSNRGECDQTGDETAVYRTMRIKGKVFTLDCSLARAGAIQPWKAYIVNKQGQWQKRTGLPKDGDWTSADVSSLNKWRIQALLRHGWPRMSSMRTYRGRPDPEENEMPRLLFTKAPNSNVCELRYPIPRTDERILRPEASWRKMYTSQLPATSVQYFTRYEMPEKNREFQVQGKVERKDGVKAGRCGGGYTRACCDSATCPCRHILGSAITTYSFADKG